MASFIVGFILGGLSTLGLLTFISLFEVVEVEDKEEHHD